MFKSDSNKILNISNITNKIKRNSNLSKNKIIDNEYIKTNNIHVIETKNNNNNDKANKINKLKTNSNSLNVLNINNLKNQKNLNKKSSKQNLITIASLENNKFVNNNNNNNVATTNYSINKSIKESNNSLRLDSNNSPRKRTQKVAFKKYEKKKAITKEGIENIKVVNKTNNDLKIEIKDNNNNKFYKSSNKTLNSVYDKFSSNVDTNIINKNLDNRNSNNNSMVKSNIYQIMANAKNKSYNIQLAKEANYIPKSSDNFFSFTKSYNKKNNINETYSKEEIYDILKRLFIAYSKYSLEIKNNIMSMTTLFYILNNKMKIISKDVKDHYMYNKENHHFNNNNSIKLDKAIVEIIIKYNISNNVHVILFEEFLNIVTTISSKMYTNFDNNQLYFLSKFISEYVIKVYNNIEVSKFEKIIKENEIDDKILQYLFAILPSFKLLYENYFYYENNKYYEYEKIRSESLLNLLDFCKDFEIVPYIINKSQIVKYYYLLKTQNIFNNIDNQGVVYTLSNFIISIYHFSLFYFLKYQGNDSQNNEIDYVYRNTNYTNYDKLILFLEKLEHSKGITNFEIRYRKKVKESFSFFPEKEIEMKEIKEKKQLEYIINSYNSLNNFKDEIALSLYDNEDISIIKKAEYNYKKINSLKKSLNTYKTNFKTLEDLKDISFDMRSLISEKEYFKPIKEIFHAYSKIGEQTNTINLMNLTGFIAFLKDSHIIKIKQTSCSNINDLIHNTNFDNEIYESNNVVNDNNNNNNNNSTSIKPDNIDVNTNKIYSNTQSMYINNKQLSSIVEENLNTTNSNNSKSNNNKNKKKELSIIKENDSNVKNISDVYIQEGKFNFRGSIIMSKMAEKQQNLVKLEKSNKSTNKLNNNLKNKKAFVKLNTMKNEYSNNINLENISLNLNAVNHNKANSCNYDALEIKDIENNQGLSVNHSTKYNKERKIDKNYLKKVKERIIKVKPLKNIINFDINNNIEEKANSTDKSENNYCYYNYYYKYKSIKDNNKDISTKKLTLDKDINSNNVCLNKNSNVNIIKNQDNNQVKYDESHYHNSINNYNYNINNLLKYTKETHNINSNNNKIEGDYNQTNSTININSVCLMFQSVLYNEQRKKKDILINNFNIDNHLEKQCSTINMNFNSNNQDICNKINLEAFVNCLEQLALIKYNEYNYNIHNALNLFFDNDILHIINQFNHKFYNKYSKNYITTQFEALYSLYIDRYKDIINILSNLVYENINIVFNKNDTTHVNLEKRLICSNKNYKLLPYRKSLHKISKYEQLKLKKKAVCVNNNNISTKYLSNKNKILNVSNTVNNIETNTNNNEISKKLVAADNSLANSAIINNTNYMNGTINKNNKFNKSQNIVNTINSTKRSSNYNNYFRKNLTNKSINNKQKIKLNFNEFKILLKRLDIFPCLVSSTYIKDLFYVCSYKNLIDINSACLAAIICGFIGDEKDMYSEEEKLYYVLLKIKSSSFGLKVIDNHTE